MSDREGGREGEGEGEQVRVCVCLCVLDREQQHTENNYMFSTHTFIHVRLCKAESMIKLY